MKPMLLTVAQPGVCADGDLIRMEDGRSFVVFPRRSGVLRAWAASTSCRRGNPFSRPLSEENQGRLEAARAAVFGGDDW